MGEDGDLVGRYSVADLNGSGVGVGSRGGRSRHLAVVWKLGKVEPLDLGTFGETRAWELHN